MKYRADIDGLRAVAVLPVLFFHAGWNVFSGGYVGVDVFFVISGYLITGILAGEIAEHRFSILNFYERRIRRIFPCLFAVIVASCIAAAVLLVPMDFRDFSKSVIATVLFGSNVLFFRQSGYFDDQSAAKPFLHTWSLAVEEQFYIVFPILLWLIHRYARDRMFFVLVPLAIFSFAFNVWGAAHLPAFTFFMAPTRVWELFAGAFLALGTGHAVGNRAVREGLAWLGLGLIVYAVFAFTSSTRFPGFNALFPVAGAALLIQFGRDTRAGWLLSRRPIVFIGLISYSLYLWHWPIIVFSEYYLVQKLTGWGTVCAVVISIVIAALSWRYVERPFRVKGLIPRRRIFQGAAAAMAGMAVVSLAGIASNGWASRFPDEVLRLEGYADAYNPRRGQCHREEDKVIPFKDSCVYGAKTVPTYAVWGDSHAVELVYALGEIAARHNESVMQLTYSACPPSLGMDIRIRPNCRDYNDKVAQFLAQDRSVKTVFLVSRYENYRWAAAEFSAGIRRSVAALLEAGKRVVLVYPIPTASVSIPRTLARYAASGADLNSFTIDEAAFLRRNSYAFQLLDSFTEANVVHVFPHKQLCHDDACVVYANGAPLYFDQQHLNIKGAEYLAPLFESLF
ncbi:MAG TPA: acyltransferase family protein [Dongiaceae bacterium]|jgi:peptidoglycan/LPS O-acetylase OafA/YrhL|nr:acyltransferase family protein [Dongiaceae bacterium]